MTMFKISINDICLHESYKSHFPKLQECAHFHYDYVEIGAINLSLTNSKQHGGLSNGHAKKSLPDSLIYDIQVVCGGKSWTLHKSFHDILAFDTCFHRCLYQRQYTKLSLEFLTTRDDESRNPSTKPMKNKMHTTFAQNSKEKISFLQTYFIRLSAFISQTPNGLPPNCINCAHILIWLEMDNKGNYLATIDDSKFASFNTQAVAAGYALKRYAAKTSEELSFERGDLISITHMDGLINDTHSIDTSCINELAPENSELLHMRGLPKSVYYENGYWWKGKHGLNVGYFPRHLVELYPVPPFFASKNIFGGNRNLSSTPSISELRPEHLNKLYMSNVNYAKNRASNGNSSSLRLRSHAPTSSLLKYPYNSNSSNSTDLSQTSVPINVSKRRSEIFLPRNSSHVADMTRSTTSKEVSTYSTTNFSSPMRVSPYKLMNASFHHYGRSSLPSTECHHRPQDNFDTEIPLISSSSVSNANNVKMLVTLFLQYFLTEGRPPRPKLRARGIIKERVFGCDLGELVVNHDLEVPRIVTYCCEWIERYGIIDGIYRISGLSSHIQKLRHTFDEEKLPTSPENDSAIDIHTASDAQNNFELHMNSDLVHSYASLLKMYFRELPNPLLTHELYQEFINVVDQPNLSPDFSVEQLSVLVSRLPPTHYTTAAYLFEHLHRMSQHACGTSMHAKNLAIVWAPNLLRAKDLVPSNWEAKQPADKNKLPQNINDSNDIRTNNRYKSNQVSLPNSFPPSPEEILRGATNQALVIEQIITHCPNIFQFLQMKDKDSLKTKDLYIENFDEPFNNHINNDNNNINYDSYNHTNRHLNNAFHDLNIPTTITDQIDIQINNDHDKIFDCKNNSNNNNSNNLNNNGNNMENRIFCNLLDVGGGIAALPKDYHTIIELSSRGDNSLRRHKLLQHKKQQLPLHNYNNNYASDVVVNNDISLLNNKLTHKFLSCKLTPKRKSLCSTVPENWLLPLKPRNQIILEDFFKHRTLNEDTNIRSFSTPIQQIQKMNERASPTPCSEILADNLENNAFITEELPTEGTLTSQESSLINARDGKPDNENVVTEFLKSTQAENLKIVNKVNDDAPYDNNLDLNITTIKRNPAQDIESKSFEKSISFKLNDINSEEKTQKDSLIQLIDIGCQTDSIINANVIGEPRCLKKCQDNFEGINDSIFVNTPRNGRLGLAIKPYKSCENLTVTPHAPTTTTKNEFYVKNDENIRTNNNGQLNHHFKHTQTLGKVQNFTTHAKDKVYSNDNDKVTLGKEMSPNKIISKQNSFHLFQVPVEISQACAYYSEPTGTLPKYNNDSPIAENGILQQFSFSQETPYDQKCLTPVSLTQLNTPLMVYPNSRSSEQPAMGVSITQTSFCTITSPIEITKVIPVRPPSPVNWESEPIFKTPLGKKALLMRKTATFKKPFLRGRDCYTDYPNHLKINKNIPYFNISPYDDNSRIKRSDSLAQMALDEAYKNLNLFKLARRSLRRSCPPLPSHVISQEFYSIREAMVDTNRINIRENCNQPTTTVPIPQDLKIKGGTNNQENHISLISTTEDCQSTMLELSPVLDNQSNLSTPSQSLPSIKRNSFRVNQEPDSPSHSSLPTEKVANLVFSRRPPLIPWPKPIRPIPSTTNITISNAFNNSNNNITGSDDAGSNIMKLTEIANRELMSTNKPISHSNVNVPHCHIIRNYSPLACTSTKHTISHNQSITLAHSPPPSPDNNNNNNTLKRKVNFMIGTPCKNEIPVNKNQFSIKCSIPKAVICDNDHKHCPATTSNPSCINLNGASRPSKPNVRDLKAKFERCHKIASNPNNNNNNVDITQLNNNGKMKYKVPIIHTPIIKLKPAMR